MDYEIGSKFVTLPSNVEGFVLGKEDSYERIVRQNRMQDKMS